MIPSANLVRISASMLVLVIGLAGCSTDYVLSGQVVRGGYGDAVLVPSGGGLPADNDGVEGIRVALYRDPGTPKRTEVVAARSRRGGYVDLEFNAFGAGWRSPDGEYSHILNCDLIW